HVTGVQTCALPILRVENASRFSTLRSIKRRVDNAEGLSTRNPRSAPRSRHFQHHSGDAVAAGVGASQQFLAEHVRVHLAVAPFKGTTFEALADFLAEGVRVV